MAKTLEVPKSDLSNIFREATIKEIKIVEDFITELQTNEIPIRDIIELSGENKLGRSNTYDISRIDPFHKKQSINLPYLYDNSGNFIGRSFNILFGGGILEYDRSKKEFDFHFSYSTGNNLKKEILERLNLESVSHGVVEGFKNNVNYDVRLYPADLNEIKRAYQEIEMVDRKLKLASRISDNMDTLLRG